MSTPRRHDEALESWLQQSTRGSTDALPSCLDAETASAWIAGSLDPTARGEAESHVAGCARCQAMLASLLAAEEEAPSSRNVAAVAARRRWLAWSAPLAAAAVLVIAAVIWVNTPDDARSPSAPPATALATQEAPAQVADAASGLSRSNDQQAQASPSARDKASDRLAARQEAPAKPADAGRTDARDASPPSLKETTFRAAVVPTSADIVSPDPNVRWRLRGSAVEGSRDAGTTWTTVPTGAVPPLMSGAAPSPTVCWVVGLRGTVLLTEDGVTWVPRPVTPAVDLVGITASSANEAVVTARDGRLFETADGGLTWTQVLPR